MTPSLFAEIVLADDTGAAVQSLLGRPCGWSASVIANSGRFLRPIKQQFTMALQQCCSGTNTALGPGGPRGARPPVTHARPPSAVARARYLFYSKIPNFAHNLWRDVRRNLERSIHLRIYISWSTPTLQETYVGEGDQSSNAD